MLEKIDLTKDLKKKECSALLDELTKTGPIAA